MKDLNPVFEFSKITDFLADWIARRPKGGFGQLSKIAKHLNISSVSMSYIMHGKRALSDEQAVELCSFLGLNELESDYFLLLAQKSRAGSHKLEARIDKKLQDIRTRAEDLRNRVPDHEVLDERAQAQFYSHWLYSAIRLSTSIEQLQDVNALAEHFDISADTARRIVDFLLQYGLCVEQNHKLKMGPQRTHLPANSPLISRHHTNWRLKSIEHADQIQKDELYFTGPMTLSEKTFQEIRSLLLDTLARTTQMIEPSKSEILACMSIDLFKIGKKI
jgi:uncharacterized protein (TIGR02147 family)